MRAPHAEMVEQRLSLGDIVLPRNHLDPPARAAAFAPVEDDAAERLRQMIEEPRARIHALRAPLLERRVEAARRVHEERRAVADDLVVRADAIEDDFSHGAGLSIAFPPGRPSRIRKVHRAKRARRWHRSPAASRASSARSRSPRARGAGARRATARRPGRRAPESKPPSPP